MYAGASALPTGNALVHPALAESCQTQLEGEVWDVESGQHVSELRPAPTAAILVRAHARHLTAATRVSASSI
jgi:hypothetical protein